MSYFKGKEFGRVLLIKPSSLGDCLHGLPVLNALRKALPEAKISWLINSDYAELLENHPGLDELILFDRGRFGGGHLWFGAIREAFRLWGQLRAGKFDLVIDLQGLLRSGIMAAATGADVRLGLADARELAGVFYTHRVQLKARDVHAVDRYMRCLEFLGIRFGERDVSLPVDPEASDQMEEVLVEAGLKRHDKFVLVSPGARWESKRWPAERFAKVIDGIQEEMSLGCVLVGSAKERQLCERLAGMCRWGVVNLASRTSLKELGALVRLSALVLGHDSGTIHLAVAMSKPLVCIIGPTDPKRTGPYGRSESIVSACVECAPCRRSVCEDNKCMRLIDAETVLAKVKSLLITRRESSQAEA